MLLILRRIHFESGYILLFCVFFVLEIMLQTPCRRAVFGRSVERVRWGGHLAEESGTAQTADTEAIDLEAAGGNFALQQALISVPFFR